jgi:cell division inhibitor SepF
MAKKFMGRFLNILGFEDQATGEYEPQRDEPAPYGAPPGRRDMPQAQQPQPSSWQPQRPPVRRRIDDMPPPQQTQPAPMARRFDESRVLPMGGGQIGGQASAGMRMVVYQPQSYDDTQRIIDDLKSGRPVIANLEDLNVDIAQRVLDFLSGAVYGLDGSIRKISRGIFLLAPPHVDISGNALGSLTSDLRSSRGSYFNLPRRPE